MRSSRWRQDALERARQAGDVLMRGDDVGPLHGVPVTIKTRFSQPGCARTSGSALRAGFIPDKHATAGRAPKAAWRNHFGQDQHSRMAMDYTADNPVIRY